MFTNMMCIKRYRGTRCKFFSVLPLCSVFFKRAKQQEFLDFDTRRSSAKYLEVIQNRNLNYKEISLLYAEDAVN